MPECPCEYCEGACEMLDDKVWQGLPCEACQEEHLIINQETGEMEAKE